MDYESCKELCPSAVTAELASKMRIRQLSVSFREYWVLYTVDSDNSVNWGAI
jgi:hypothetical protein